MATQFKNKVIREIGVAPILALETDASTRSTIIGLNLANLTDFIAYISIQVKADDSVIGYLMKDVMIPANSSLKALAAGEKLILAPSNALYLTASGDESVDAVISYVDIV